MTDYIRRREVRRLMLDEAFKKWGNDSSGKPWFRKVSPSALDEINFAVHRMVTRFVQAHPTKGHTLKT